MQSVLFGVHAQVLFVCIICSFVRVFQTGLRSHFGSRFEIRFQYSHYNKHAMPVKKRAASAHASGSASTKRADTRAALAKLDLPQLGEADVQACKSVCSSSRPKLWYLDGFFTRCFSAYNATKSVGLQISCSIGLTDLYNQVIGGKGGRVLMKKSLNGIRGVSHSTTVAKDVTVVCSISTTATDCFAEYVNRQLRLRSLQKNLSSSATSAVKMKLPWRLLRAKALELYLRAANRLHSSQQPTRYCHCSIKTCRETSLKQNFGHHQRLCSQRLTLQCTWIWMQKRVSFSMSLDQFSTSHS